MNETNIDNIENILSSMNRRNLAFVKLDRETDIYSFIHMVLCKVGGENKIEPDEYIEGDYYMGQRLQHKLIIPLNVIVTPYGEFEIGESEDHMEFSIYKR